MKVLDAYQQTKWLISDPVKLFEELYMKLAQQCEEMVLLRANGQYEQLVTLADRMLFTLSLMDQQIDLTKSPEISARILHLHRFLFRSLVAAKLDPSSPALDGLGKVFIEMAGIFAAMANSKAPSAGSQSA